MVANEELSQEPPEHFPQLQQGRLHTRAIQQDQGVVFALETKFELPIVSAKSLIFIKQYSVVQ